MCWKGCWSTSGRPAVRPNLGPRARGERFLLERNIFRRVGTGRPAGEQYLDLVYPNRLHYDTLRALDHFRAAGTLTGAGPEPGLADAVEHLRSRRSPDGRWPLDRRQGGRVWFDLDDGPGRPSRWITLRALRVLRWWDKVL